MRNQILNVKSLIFLFAITLLASGVQGISYGQAAPTVEPGDDDTSLIIKFRDAWTFGDFREAYYLQYRKKTPQGPWVVGCFELRITGLSPFGGLQRGTVSATISRLEPGTTYQVRYNNDTGLSLCPPTNIPGLPFVGSGPWSAIGEGTTSDVQQQGPVRTEPTVLVVDPDSPSIYWVDWGADKIQRANLDGSNVEDLVTRGLDRPVGIALDVAGGKMYWTDIDTAKIQRANLDGSNVEDLVTRGLEGPGDIALDVTGGKMYWTDGNPDKIQRANLDGSNIEDIVPSTGNSLGNIALDVAGGKMYWTSLGGDKIRRANLDGSNIEDIVTRGLEDPSGIALDVAGGKMYWTDWGTDKIQRANLDGSNIEDIVTRGLENPGDIALDTVGGKMYWIDGNPDKIQRANLDGSNIEDIVTGLQNIADIALDTPSMSITVQQPTQPTGETTYSVGEDIPTLPTGSWFPDSVLGTGGGARASIGGGQTTITFGNGGAIIKDGITYTCVAAGGCTIEEGRRITRGTIQASGGGQLALSTSTASPLIETTLDESEVTLTLTAATYEQNGSNISNAVTVSGIDGVTVDRVRRRSDTEIAIDLAFDGTDFDADVTLIFTIGADAIANYTGTELTAQVSVTASKESLTASTKSPLTADTLDGSVVTLTLSDRTFSPPFHGLIGNQAVAGIRGVKVSGIPGLTIPSTRVPVNIFINGVQQFGTRYGIDRISDTELEVELAFDGNLDSDTTITFTVEAEAIESYNGPAITADISVAAPSSVALRDELTLTMFGDIKRTALLQNFPNPFNPETWIPYRLADDTNVSLSIYDINGALVRELDLGHQRAGYYTDRMRAAYWDGRNESGELVASGVYFYQLRAGDYLKLRKMVIVK